MQKTYMAKHAEALAARRWDLVDAQSERVSAIAWFSGPTNRNSTFS